MASEPPLGNMRGIINPEAMLKCVTFERFPSGPALAGLVEWFWSVAWNLPDGASHDQEVLSHPAGNISIGTIDDSGIPLDPPQGRVYGVVESRCNRHLTGAGWTVAARSTVGGLGVFLDAPASQAADRQLSLGDGLPGCDPERMVSEVCEQQTNVERVTVLREHLEAVVASRDPETLAEARWLAETASKAELNREICRTEQLAEIANCSVRSLQRLFDQHVGRSPAYVIRRWRIIEAAEVARLAIANDESWRGWAVVASELGYSDQSHLVRDFVRHLGVSPSVFVARNRD